MEVHVYRVRSSRSDRETFEAGEERMLISVTKVRDGLYEATVDQVFGGDGITFWQCRASAEAKSSEEVVAKIVKFVYASAGKTAEVVFGKEGR